MLFEPNASNATGEYIICRDDRETEEFLAQVVDKGPMNDLAWTQEPVEAIHYTSPDEAAAEAKRIVGNMNYALTICEVHLQGTKARLRPVIEFKPKTNGH